MDKEKQVYDMLDKVYDPELDQPLTDLGFIDRIVIENDKVEVVFRLPTYWCSPNFAYIMAEDIHDYVSQLNWVHEVKVNLIDHCNSSEINQGVNSKRAFSESLRSFGGSDAELDELRKTFQIKAFYARQEKIIKHLLNKEGLQKEDIVTLSLEAFYALPLKEEGPVLREKYLEKKLWLDHGGNEAFTTPEGDVLSLETFSEYLLGLKRTRLSMEFNGHYCRGLLEARYNLPSTNEEGAMSR
ncbi:iron-sulfur cluster assembly protein [Halalkalibacterium ligniniphilum]|uniref:iron-sulfur cluster assembly protein n=1 Tax=Halalkalibacterium ligniniphilum TaxID=1134413 RepID=UPI000346123C|nr:iron-sulfur cluster assembly protein [Halalkalibacterium ligniniphilum]